MRKSTFSFLTVFVFASLIILQSCKDDSYLLSKPPVADQSFAEEFDTATAAINRGWVIKNTSDPGGSGIWQQAGGILPWFNAFSSNGTYVGFIGADYTSTNAAEGVISNWLISPVVTMQNGDKIVFYTRCLLFDAGTGGDSTDFGTRLQVRYNKRNDGVNTGTGTDPGDFTESILDINSSYVFYHSDPLQYSPVAYPARWTRFEATVVGLNEPVKGRFAFRYYLEGGGFNGLGSGVAVDKVSYISVNHQ